MGPLEGAEGRWTTPRAVSSYRACTEGFVSKWVTLACEDPWHWRWQGRVTLFSAMLKNERYHLLLWKGAGPSSFGSAPGEGEAAVMGPEFCPSGCPKVETPLVPGFCLLIPRKSLHGCI